MQCDQIGAAEQESALARVTVAAAAGWPTCTVPFRLAGNAMYECGGHATHSARESWQPLSWPPTCRYAIRVRQVNHCPSTESDDTSSGRVYATTRCTVPFRLAGMYKCGGHATHSARESWRSWPPPS